MESFNPGGSMKDRSSLNIVQKALKKGLLRKGDTIVESSSGNMAIGLAQTCLHFGLKLMVVVDPKLNGHTAKILKAYGAKLEMVTDDNGEGGFLGARLRKVQELVQKVPNAFWSDQYSNPNNPSAHHETMDEIAMALNGKVDYLFVATSTCGTVMGCSDYVIKNGLQTKVIAVDAVGSILFGGKPRKRLIPGHGAGVPSNFLKPQNLSGFVHVDDLGCIEGCWQLLREEAIMAGGSTGAIVSAFNSYSENIPDDANCALLVGDSGERYLDTIYNREWIREHFSGDRLLKLIGEEAQL
tara:strand:- start:155443 stop:156333 length:891 start_codon:yes stop_codon:yes gene_type:complete